MVNILNVNLKIIHGKPKQQKHLKIFCKSCQKKNPKAFPTCLYSSPI